jgi:predicted Zn-dependent protease
MRRSSLFALLLAGSTAAAQVPETYTNLQVLPEDISRGELVALMRGFTEALDVRCSTCHMGEESQPLSEYDFASDDREMKVKARAMLRMVRAINTDHVAPLGGSVQVECFTCHRGASSPQRLEAVLVAAWQSAGADSLERAYRGYRDQYYGRAVFDFGPETLVRTAQQLFRLPNGPQGAHRALTIQTTLFPDDGQGWVAFGQTLAATGDTAAAITALERAVTLLGANPQLQRMLGALRGNR